MQTLFRVDPREGLGRDQRPFVPRGRPALDLSLKLARCLVQFELGVHLAVPQAIDHSLLDVFREFVTDADFARQLGEAVLVDGCACRLPVSEHERA